jgi:hypothetical protein
VPYKLGGTVAKKFTKAEQINLKPFNLLQAAVDGDVEKSKLIIEKLGLISVAGITGLEKEGVEMFGESADTSDWNPFHFAVYFDRIDLVKYYFSLIEHGFNIRYALNGPSQGPDKESGTLMFPSIDEQCFSLVLAINN